MPDPADTSSSVEEPPVKPADDGGAPAPSDGSTGGQDAPDPMAPEPAPRAGSGPHPAGPHTAGRRPPAGPPTDPGNDQTG